MSTQDESLMWDILDLTSFDVSQAQLSLGTHPPLESERLEDTNDISRSSSDEDPTQQEVETLNISPGKRYTLAEEAEVLTDDMPAPDWPFSSRAGNNTVGSGIPDIPDWMIFGDLMTEHL